MFIIIHKARAKEKYIHVSRCNETLKANCNERRKAKCKGLGYTGSRGGRGHLKIETRLRGERFERVMGECDL